MWHNWFDMFNCVVDLPDSVERFHISSFILFVFAQYTVEAEYPWFEKFIVVSSFHLSELNTRWGMLNFGSKKILPEFVSLILGFVCICAFPEFQNASMVYICEIMIDIIKHSFIAKFNDIKPIVFSEFLEDLYRQV